MNTVVSTYSIKLYMLHCTCTYILSRIRFGIISLNLMITTVLWLIFYIILHTVSARYNSSFRVNTAVIPDMFGAAPPLQHLTGGINPVCSEARQRHAANIRVSDVKLTAVSFWFDQLGVFPPTLLHNPCTEAHTANGFLFSL